MKAIRNETTDSPRSDPRPGVLADGGRLLDAFLAEAGEPAFRSGQIRRWLFRSHVDSFEDMTDLSVGLRERLAERFRLFSSSVDNAAGAIDTTQKLLIRLQDQELIEAVLIREDPRATACVSTQVGCPIGCPFCASGLDGTRRNLDSHEIVEQILLLDRLAGDGGLTHLVFMGIGEPLLNFENLRDALTTLQSDRGFGMASRRITLSTVAPPGKIRRLAEIPLPINLAISLHAPDDALRDELVPANCGVDALVEAAAEYRRSTGRQVTFEYVLLHEVNDRPEQARALARLLEGTDTLVNLIPFNPVPGTGFEPPTAAAVAEFRAILERGSISTMVRKRKGRKIDAACGQLRLRSLRNRPPVDTQAS